MELPHVCIDNWTFRDNRLWGAVRNHPRFEEGDLIMSSEVQFIDPNGSFIQTANTVYVLGVPEGMGT